MEFPLKTTTEYLPIINIYKIKNKEKLVEKFKNIWTNEINTFALKNLKVNLKINEVNFVEPLKDEKPQLEIDILIQSEKNIDEIFLNILKKYETKKDKKQITKKLKTLYEHNEFMPNKIDELSELLEFCQQYAKPGLHADAYVAFLALFLPQINDL